MSNEIREAVQMVLTRMATHPDDFHSQERHTYTNAPRFEWVWNAINGSGSYGLNGAEIDALKQGFDKLMYRKFHDRVLESMLNEPETYEKMAQQGSSLKASKYVFTRSQAEIAKRLGVSPQEYARAMSKVTK
jgi:hypothetical protein